VHDKPIIGPKYYQGPGGELDFQIMVAAQAFGPKITSTSLLSSIILKRVFPPQPEQDGNEEEDVGWIRSRTSGVQWFN